MSSTDRRTDRRTDGRTRWIQYTPPPPSNFVGRGYNKWITWQIRRTRIKVQYGNKKLKTPRKRTAKYNKEYRKSLTHTHKINNSANGLQLPENDDTPTEPDTGYWTPTDVYNWRTQTINTHPTGPNEKRQTGSNDVRNVNRNSLGVEEKSKIYGYTHKKPNKHSIQFNVSVRLHDLQANYKKTSTQREHANLAPGGGKQRPHTAVQKDGNTKHNTRGNLQWEHQHPNKTWGTIHIIIKLLHKVRQLIPTPTPHLHERKNTNTNPR